jgi:hypothetical protein
MLEEVSPSKKNYLHVRRSISLSEEVAASSRRSISLSEEVTASEKKFLPLRGSNYMLEEVSPSQKK